MNVRPRPGRSIQTRKLHRFAVACLLYLLSASAHAEVFGDIRVSRIGSSATVEVEFACALRYVDHQQALGGTELHVQLIPGHDCRLALRDIRSDLRRPLSGRLAHMSELEFVSKNNADATLIVRFEKAVLFDVKQSPNMHMLTIEVDRDAEVVPVEADPVVADIVVPQVDSFPPVGTQNSTRQLHTPSTLEQNKFVIRVMKWSPEDSINYSLLEPYRSRVIYTNEIVLGERRWSELKLGFFNSEFEAQETLTKLSENFSLAWITTANPIEQAAAQQNQIEWPDENPMDATPAAMATVAGETATLSADDIETLMSDAKFALLRREYTTSIEIYEKLLGEPTGDHRRQAREFLGVALQKNNQTDQARAEFEAYLGEFSGGTDAKRVQQRLAALSMADNIQRRGSEAQPDAGDDDAGDNSARIERRRQSSGWEIFGSASQFYLHGVNLAEGNNEDLVAQSAMFSQAHMVATRRGERFDLTARTNLGYLYNLADNGPEQQVLVSYAYLDIADTKSDISLRVGRQQQLSSGILSRFDGLHASYQYRPDLTLNLTAGFPVDSQRFLASTDHYSYGVSADFNDIVGKWDLSVYANQQMIDGIKDRQAIGAEALFQNDAVTLVGLLDFDTSYNIINTVLINGSWRAHDRITVHGRVRTGVAPFLSTRNAIIGQPVNTLRELFDSYTEGQIRRLARDRTADERFASGGLSAALTSRLQIRFDASYLEYSTTVASGGVAAFTETGPQYTYSGHLQGSGYFKSGQVMQLGYRRTETERIDRDTVWFDMRYPIGEKWRLQARASYANRIANQNPAGDIDQRVINPLLRVVYSGSRRYRIEFEAGGQWSNREFPLTLMPPLVTDGTLEQRDYYVQLGYTLDF